MGTIIKQRINNIAVLHSLISKENVISEVQNIRRLLLPNTGVMKKVSKKDFSGSDRSEIIDWLQKRRKDLEPRVYIYWLSDQEGVEMGFDDFVSHFDDLWYPSADDVWITNQERTAVVELNHEEIFSLYTISKTT